MTVPARTRLGPYEMLNPLGAGGMGEVYRTRDTRLDREVAVKSNLEVVAKILDACGPNSRYWTFAGRLTNVDVTLTVTDTQTGATRTYSNPQGTSFEPIQETGAFACP